MARGGKRAMPDYLCFTALEAGTFTLSIPAGLTTDNLRYVEFSIDEGGSWVRTDNVDDTAVTITTPTIQAGDKVYWRGSAVRYSNGTDHSVFSATCNFNASGHINSLCYWDNVLSDKVSTNKYKRLFYGNTKLIDASGIIVPNALDSNMLYATFRGCSNLLYPPVLPVLKMVTSCYRELYFGCRSLKKIINYSTSSASTNAYYQWTGSNSGDKVPSTCILVCNYDATISFADRIKGNCGSYIFYDIPNDKYYLSDKVTECDDNGNPILGG